VGCLRKLKRNVACRMETFVRGTHEILILGFIVHDPSLGRSDLGDTVQGEGGKDQEPYLLELNKNRSSFISSVTSIIKCSIGSSNGN